jgi:hypothetical protein
LIFASKNTGSLPFPFLQCPQTSKKGFIIFSSSKPG